MNQLQGRIDISFKVKGTKSGGVMKFASFRPSPRGMFETSEWSLVTDDGVVIDLLEEGDPFKVMTGAAALDAVDAEAAAVAAVEEDEAAAVARGFRKK
jgi:cytochrome c oxidase assembly factor 1